MYSHSQWGICSVAPLTLPSRALSRACVYLPLFVLTSPRPCRENTSRGGGKGSHAALHRQPAPRHTTTSPRCPKSQWVGSEWPQTAPPATSSDVWGAFAWPWGFLGGGVVHQRWHFIGLHKGQQKHSGLFSHTNTRSPVYFMSSAKNV